MSCCCVGVYG